jgi:hypothetical protein
MIRNLSYLLAFLYCFVWLRIPDIAGVALPLQRMVAWTGLAVILAHAAVKGPLQIGPQIRSFLRVALLFLAFLLVNLVQKLTYGGTEFYLLYFLMDFSKYVAIFTVAFIIYYSLSSGLVREEGLVRNLVWSGAASILLVFTFLSLYLIGFRSDSTLIAPSFGGALGVWPTSGFWPRLAGTAAEPQQLSVLLLTPLLLMLSPLRIRRLWPIAALGVLAMLMSQSKFAVISCAFIALYLLLVYRERRKLLIACMAVAAPVLAIALLRLPTFAETLSQGTEAGAFVERLENLVLLLDVIRNHAVFGIGPGQYGIFRGIMLFGDPTYAPGYYPNMDFLKIFAEVGIVGFLIVITMLGSFVRFAYRAYRRLPWSKRERYLAFFLGALAILCNMLIGYELLHVFFWVNVGVLIYLAETSHETLRIPDSAAS